MLNIILEWIARSLAFGTVIMFGAMGETLTEKSGNMNLGTPGNMCIGGVCAFCATYLYQAKYVNVIVNENGAKVLDPSAFDYIMMIVLGICVGFLSAALAGLLFSFLTTTLRANQNVAGLAITIFGAGLAKFMRTLISAETAAKATVANTIFAKSLPFAGSLGWFGSIVFKHGFMFYLAIAIAILLHIVFKKTRTGLNLRAVGEGPATADAAGINVTKYKYVATVIGAGISGLGGVFYILEYNNGTLETASVGAIEALGWLALALVIFSVWRPLNLIWSSFLFGACYWLYNYISVFGVKTTTAQVVLLEMIPYIVTIIVLVISSVRKKRENQPPASLGLSYFREER